MKSTLDLNHMEALPETLPVVPTMDVVVFPHMIVPLLVLDPKIVAGINSTLESSKMVFLLAAKEYTEAQGTIGSADLYQIGTVASVVRIIKIPEGGVKVLVQGMCRAKATDVFTQDEAMHATIEPHKFAQNDPEELLPHIRNIKGVAEKMASAGNAFSPDFHIILSKMHSPDKIADFVLSHLNLSVEDAQHLLESPTQEEFLGQLYHFLNKEIELAEMQEKIKNNARDSMNRSQKEYYLREQLRAIREELGDADMDDVEQMHEKLSKLQMPDESREEVRRQITRLEHAAPDSLESVVARNHLEWIFALPWSTETEDCLKIDHAKKVLDEDHFGLHEVKDRILDLISVRNLKKDSEAPILCIVGPPGTGKTSLGKSIARSLGRAYARISLGGVRDEAEIRGHRRTYVGALPGRFIQAMRKANSLNPVIVIDELDKIGADFRGDPSAAMLEVLDPQQNNAFYDNYLGIPFNLSRAMFVATANTLDTISGPLQDRMEIIELPGYTLEEKVSICKNHLIGKAAREIGVDSQGFALDDGAIGSLVNDYTREAGVRQLERLVKKLCTKAARTVVEKGSMPAFTKDCIDNYLGPRKFMDEEALTHDQIGISNGLAKTAFGGEIIKIEAVLVPGKGRLILTGQLGDVMKESAQAALSYARAHAKEFGIASKQFDSGDLHIHVPAGAVPKDGPSAGITLLTAILSAFTNRPISAQYAMTGELNLRGEVMPIGGVKDKILAAKRSNVAHVILPQKNKDDLIGIEDVTEGIDIVFVSHANEVLSRVLTTDKPKKPRA